MLAEAAQNKPLFMLWAALSAIADGHEAGVRYPSNVLGHAERAHERIYRTVRDKDPDAAARAMTAHLDSAIEHVRTFHRPLFDGAVRLLAEE
ncbi:FCD domain-containing protein [Yinghuangia aomiensis]